MKPIDYRNETFEQIQERLAGLRGEIYERMQECSEPLTTRQWAMRLGIDILTLRPRITELHQLGFVTLTGGHDGQGLYAALSPYMARMHYSERAHAAREPQLELAL